MTGSDAASNSGQNIEPGDIEALLPWYAAGTLRRRDRQRVEAALRQDAELARQGLARQIDLVREELAETIHLNETLGAPPPHVADRLMAAIDAETNAARKHVPGSVAGWLTGFFASLPPRTLAVAASFAVLAIALQAFMLVDVFTKPQGSSQLASLGSAHAPRKFCDGAFRASGERRRDHQFPAQLSGRAGGRSDGRRALSRAHRDEVARQRRARQDRRAHAARSRRGVGRAAPRPPNLPSRANNPGLPSYPTANASIFPHLNLSPGGPTNHWWRQQAPSARYSPIPSADFQTRPASSPPGGSSISGMPAKARRIRCFGQVGRQWPFAPASKMADNAGRGGIVGGWRYRPRNRGPDQGFCRFRRGALGQSARRARQHSRHDRPERCRQNHLLQFAEQIPHSDPRPHRVRWTRHHRAAGRPRSRGSDWCARFRFPRCFRI